MKKEKDRYLGCLMGLVVGDALGDYPGVSKVREHSPVTILQRIFEETSFFNDIEPILPYKKFLRV